MQRLPKSMRSPKHPVQRAKTKDVTWAAAGVLPRQSRLLKLRVNGHSKGFLQNADAADSQLREAARAIGINSTLLDAGNTTGSDTMAMGDMDPPNVAKHYQAAANLCRTLGEAQLPTVAVLDGFVSGAAVGLGAHASACVVTERTRVSLLGPLFGAVPESFAAYQLARLPQPGLGAYLALTGASLTGQEMLEAGLATHSTESQALWRIEDELDAQRHRHLGRTLRNLDLACIEPRLSPYTEGHALYYQGRIQDCFAGAETIGGILTKLDAGSTLWHAQCAHALRLSSPLALGLTLRALQAAEAAGCWTEALSMEVSLYARAAKMPDAVRGARGLASAKAALRREVTADAKTMRMPWAAVDDDISEEEICEMMGLNPEEVARDREEAEARELAVLEQAVARGGGAEQAAIAWEHTGDVDAAAMEAYLA